MNETLKTIVNCWVSCVLASNTTPTSKSTATPVRCLQELQREIYWINLNKKPREQPKDEERVEVFWTKKKTHRNCSLRVKAASRISTRQRRWLLACLIRWACIHILFKRWKKLLIQFVFQYSRRDYEPTKSSFIGAFSCGWAWGGDG